MQPYSELALALCSPFSDFPPFSILYEYSYKRTFCSTIKAINTAYEIDQKYLKDKAIQVISCETHQFIRTHPFIDFSETALFL